MAHRSNAAPAPLPSKVPYAPAHRGDRFVMTGPIGGGYGDAMSRDPAAVHADWLDGFITTEDAAQIYGVAIEGNAVDAQKTAALRSAKPA